MSQTTIVTTRISTTVSVVALGGGASFAVSVLVLHVLKPEIEPSWRFISEYALGDFGWLMHLAFLAFAAGHAGLIISLRRLISQSWSGRLGLVALALNGVGLALAGVFRTDPVTLDPQLATTAGRLHALGGALGTAMPVSVALVSWSLVRTIATTGRAIWPSAALALFGAVSSIIALGVLLTRSDGRFGPDVHVGWPNRLEIATYVVWFLDVAARCVRLGPSEGGGK